VITADHGEEFFDHDSVGHGHNVFQELLHVPLIVRIPGLTEGEHRVPDAAGLVDVMPTVLEALGMEPPEALTGRSLWPLLRGLSESAPRAALSGFHDGWRTVLVGNHKLVQRTDRHTMLFDLSTDPDEKNDLSSSRP